ncbi:gnat family [Diplodia corticola]|uniref:Gnat family n=1 Tax=Diplodia corticola TaxID=236234 RepID=A0A1J9RSV4_9PEZI|nr:gnat family [Diplodia corticola]OJD30948.1 gnat family [Diplodia corticola]
MVGPLAEGKDAHLGHSLPQVHDHTGSPETTLLPHLHHTLPYALPLYRRIQFGHHSPHTRILATVPSSPPPPPPTNDGGEQDRKAQEQEQEQTLHQCFAATFIDRSRRPETESWVYVSWDHPSHHLHHHPSSSSSSSTMTTKPPSSCTCSSHLLALLSHIAANTGDDAAAAVPYPPLTAAEESDIWAAVTAADARETAARYHAHTSTSAARYLDDLHAPAMLKVGSMHARGVAWATGLGFLRRDGVGTGFAYRKYVFSMTTSQRRGGGDDDDDDENGTAEGEDGGEGEGKRKKKDGDHQRVMGEGDWEGLRWGRLSEDDLTVTRSRTAIPRTNRTLRTLPSVAVFADAVASDGGPEEEGEEEKRGTQKQKPVAWAFLAADGSLSSLHVEPEYRGKGLAKAMGWKIFQEGWGAFGDDLNGLAHADVALENAESNGVCKSLGGIDQDWHVYWVRIDLDRVRAVVTASA